MRTFVDSSALYALLDADDANHSAAAGWLSGPGTASTDSLVTHNYVLVEAAALVHHRLGARGVRDLFDAFVPALSVTFVDAALHARATAAYLASLTRRVSFVDRAASSSSGTRASTKPSRSIAILPPKASPSFRDRCSPK